MMKNLVKAVIVIGVVAGMTGCSNGESVKDMENLKVHTQIEIDQVGNGQVQEDDTMIPVLTKSMIEFNGKTYNSSNKIDELVADLGVDVSNYDDNVALSEDKTIFALGNLERFEGMKVNGVEVDASMSDLKALGADILDNNVASINNTTFYFDKEGNMETFMVSYR